MVWLNRASASNPAFKFIDTKVLAKNVFYYCSLVEI